MRKLSWGMLAAICLTSVGLAQGAEPAADDEGWIDIFNGESLEGWKASEKPENWTVEEGCLVGRGERSHLFYVEREFADLEFQAEVQLNHGGNSGMYFRVAFGPEWPKGYEAQVNNSGGDPKRTGSLYNFVSVEEQLVEDDTWWTQHIRCEGNHIVITVNDRVVVDFVDENDTYQSGFVALQQHDPGSVVKYRNLRVRPLNE